MTPGSACVLVVEDDPSIRRGLAAELAANGYAVLEAADGRQGIDLFASGAPDLVLTDLAMPVADGFELIREVRRSGATPVVVLSVRGADVDKIRALDLGADDFVTKPFSVPELLARIRAQLRRSGAAPARSVLEFEGLTIDLERRRVVQAEREVKLTPTEFAILELLATNAGKPVTTARIIARVWKGAPGRAVGAARAPVGRRGKRPGPAPASPRYVVTEPWVGYRFVAEPLPD